MEALLDAGAGELEEPLYHAAGNGFTAIAALLLDHGADVHYGDDDVLWYTAHAGHLETATLLLQRGATAHNHILAAAVRQGHPGVADLLRAHGAV